MNGSISAHVPDAIQPLTDQGFGRFLLQLHSGFFPDRPPNEGHLGIIFYNQLHSFNSSQKIIQNIPQCGFSAPDFQPKISSSFSWMGTA
jgi:hypothetical protein